MKSTCNIVKYKYFKTELLEKRLDAIQNQEKKIVSKKINLQRQDIACH